MLIRYLCAVPGTLWDLHDHSCCQLYQIQPYYSISIITSSYPNYIPHTRLRTHWYQSPTVWSILLLGITATSAIHNQITTSTPPPHLPNWINSSPIPDAPHQPSAFCNSYPSSKNNTGYCLLQRIDWNSIERFARTWSDTSQLQWQPDLFVPQGLI